MQPVGVFIINGFIFSQWYKSDQSICCHVIDVGSGSLVMEATETVIALTLHIDSSVRGIAIASAVAFLQQ